MTAAIAMSSPRVRAAFKLPSIAALTLIAGVASAIAFFWWFNARGGLLNFAHQAWPNSASLWIFHAIDRRRNLCLDCVRISSPANLAAHGAPIDGHIACWSR